MARVYGVTCLCILIGVVLVDNVAEGLVVIRPHGKLEALPGRKCLNLLFPEPCQDNYLCNISLKLKLESNNALGVTSKSLYTVKSKEIMKINSTYILCMIDYGENVSCCNDISRNPSINFMTGFQVTLSYDQEISFDLKACNSTCLTMHNFFKAVLPWHDPCYFGKPCQNFGTCQPAFNSYTCLCRGNWNGTNCTIPKDMTCHAGQCFSPLPVPDGSVPKDMTYHAGQCLNYLSNADVKLHMKTVGECRRACLNQGPSSCKAFQFKQMSGSHGNCTLRNSNSLEQKVQSCDMDLYEFTNLLIPPSPAHSAPNAVATVTLYLLLASLTIFFS